MILYRPVNKSELDLIEKSGWKEFPPRLPQQPIFYPVLNIEYARQITIEWNLPAYGSGFIVSFDVDDKFISKYTTKNVGCDIHDELWVPSEDLDEFNKNIIGVIKLIESF